jgi:hypothetical protein
MPTIHATCAACSSACTAYDIIDSVLSMLLDDLTAILAVGGYTSRWVAIPAVEGYSSQVANLALFSPFSVAC